MTDALKYLYVASSGDVAGFAIEAAGAGTDG
jgi:hypothetical protein